MLFPMIATQEEIFKIHIFLLFIKIRDICDNPFVSIKKFFILARNLKVYKSKYVKKETAKFNDFASERKISCLKLPYLVVRVCANDRKGKNKDKIH